MTIGFRIAPAKIEEWTRDYCGSTFKFSKAPKGSSFEYNCSKHFEEDKVTGDTTTGVVLEFDLTRAQVESMKQFVDFMEALT